MELFIYVDMLVANFYIVTDLLFCSLLLYLVRNLLLVIKVFRITVSIYVYIHNLVRLSYNRPWKLIEQEETLYKQGIYPTLETVQWCLEITCSESKHRNESGSSSCSEAA